MKSHSKLFAFFLAFFLICSISSTAYASETDADLLIREMINYYQYHGAAAETDIARLNARLAEIAPEQAELWDNVLSYWTYANEEMERPGGILPDGLPEDDSLCIVVLGYALNGDGTMQKELIGRLETALASAQKYPNAYIACTGGGTARYQPNATEADAMAQWLMAQGIDESRIIIENKSQTTTQNARLTYAILSEDYPKIQSLAMVTSDYHLPRGCTLFYTQSALAAAQGSRSFEVVGCAAYETKYSSPEALTLQADNIAALAGLSVSSMEEPELSRLTDITVSGETYCDEGGSPNLTVTAHYNTGFSKVVDAQISDFDSSAPGKKAVTISYAENGSECSIDLDILVLPAATEAPTEAAATEAAIETTPHPVPEEGLTLPVVLIAVWIVLIVLLLILLLVRKRH